MKHYSQFSSCRNRQGRRPLSDMATHLSGAFGGGRPYATKDSRQRDLRPGSQHSDISLLPDLPSRPLACHAGKGVFAMRSAAGNETIRQRLPWSLGRVQRMAFRLSLVLLTLAAAVLAMSWDKLTSPIPTSQA